MKNLNNHSGFLSSKSSLRITTDKKTGAAAATVASLSSASTSSSHSGASSSNDEATNAEDTAFLKMNSHNNSNSKAAKTSVFERLYKSNIAAHMSDKETNSSSSSSSSLKKAMSVSSASLASSNGLNTSCASNPGSSVVSRKSYIPSSTHHLQQQRHNRPCGKSLSQAKSIGKLTHVGSSDESQENQSNGGHEAGNESSSESVSDHSAGELKSSDVNFIESMGAAVTVAAPDTETLEKTVASTTTQSSFLSHKLMDLFKK